MTEQADYTDQMEAPVTDDAVPNPVLTEYQTEDEQHHWCDELAASKKERDRWLTHGNAVIKRYSNERASTESAKKLFNIFFANTEIKQAALFAQSPMPDIRRRFDDPDDDVSRVAAMLLQRNIAYELEADGFDDTFKQVLFDRLVPGMGMAWVRFEQEDGEPAVDPLTGQPGAAEVRDQCAKIDYVSFDDVAWAVSKTWTECRWIARRIPMSKGDCRHRFGNTAADGAITDLNFSKVKKNKTVNGLGPKNQTQATVDVWEIWDKERELIFWIAEDAARPLDVQEDTNEFPGFFPTPLPPLGRFNNSNTLPISDYSLVQDQYNELDDLNARVANLVKALKLTFVYDSSQKELTDLFSSTSELEGIPIERWSELTEKGGMQNVMQFTPLEPVAAAYSQLLSARAQVKDQINEIEGISDIQRGVTDRYVSATATQAAGQYGTTRIGISQKQVAKYIESLLRLKAHLICRFYEPRFIVERAGQLPQADQGQLMPALQLLKDAQFRHFRLIVSTDAIQLPNWNQEKAERNELIQAISSLMGQLLPAVQQTPALAPLGLQLLKFGVAGFKGSNEIEGVLDASLQQLLASQAQSQGTPPPPSPAEIKLQIAQTAAQAAIIQTNAQEQTKQAIAQTKAQLQLRDQALKQQGNDIKSRAVDAQIEHNRAQEVHAGLTAAHAVAVDVTGLGGV